MDSFCWNKWPEYIPLLVCLEIWSSHKAPVEEDRWLRCGPHHVMIYFSWPRRTSRSHEYSTRLQGHESSCMWIRFNLVIHSRLTVPQNVMKRHKRLPSSEFGKFYMELPTLFAISSQRLSYCNVNQNSCRPTTASLTLSWVDLLAHFP